MTTPDAVYGVDSEGEPLADLVRLNDHYGLNFQQIADFIDAGLVELVD
jgi:hypothetical protein